MKNLSLGRMALSKDGEGAFDAVVDEQVKGPHFALGGLGLTGQQAAIGTQ